MEDEYICVDDLEGHLGDSVNLPSHGAFYGVCNLLLLFSFQLERFCSENHTSLLVTMNFPLSCDQMASYLLALFIGFLQVFDGHGGVDAASFIKKNLLNFIVQDSHFPDALKKATRSAFVKADHAIADATSLDKSSGTTALTAFILGR